jgi:hypothetical protein
MAINRPLEAELANGSAFNQQKIPSLNPSPEGVPYIGVSVGIAQSGRSRRDR